MKRLWLILFVVFISCEKKNTPKTVTIQEESNKSSDSKPNPLLAQKLYEKYKKEARENLAREARQKNVNEKYKEFPKELLTKVSGTADMNVKRGVTRFSFVTELYNKTNWKMNKVFIVVKIYSKDSRSLLTSWNISKKLDVDEGIPFTKTELFFYAKGEYFDVPFLEKDQYFDWELVEIQGYPYERK